MLTSSQQGRIYKKNIDDSGVISGFERIDPVGGTNSYNFINQFVLDPVTNNKLYVCSANRLWRNNDVAGISVTNNFYDRIETNWEMLDVVSGSQRLSALDISLAQPNTLWYGTTNGRVYRVDSLYTTPDRTLITSDQWPFASYVSCVAPNDYDAAEWLVTFSNYGVRSVFHTVDSGATWVSVSGNLEQFPDGSGNGPAVFWAMIYPTYDNANNRYFVGTSTGLYSTAVLDGDNTVWEMEGPDGMGNVPINMITARGSDGLIAVATHGLGVFTSHLPAAPIGITEAQGPLSISAAWPNPAMDQVSVDLFLAQAGRVEVTVYDLHGRTVLRTALGERSAGNSRFTWDLRDAAGTRVGQGTYLLHLRASSGAGRTARVVVW